MIVAHKIALRPNNAQATYFRRASGVARFAYNWALGEWKRQYEARKQDPSLPAPSETSLRRQLNSIKRAQFPWMFDVTKCAPQEAIIDLGAAFRAFFEGRGKYPRFKKKGSRDSFCAANEVGRFRCSDTRIRLPNVGWVRTHEALRFSGMPKRVTVSREGDRWYASVMVETDDIKPIAQSEEAVGVDLGITSLMMLSNGQEIPGPKAHKAELQRIRRLSRSLSRKRKGSRNAARAKQKLARLHRRIANVRRDATHKATTMLAKTFRLIGIENLNVKGMAANRRLARSVMDASFFEIRRQLQYKTKMYGSTLVVADRWFPSSKTCSCCGSVKAELALSQRTFVCDACDHEAPRDLNAALNLERLAASSAVSACGAERSGTPHQSRVKRAAVKHEVSFKPLCVGLS